MGRCPLRLTTGLGRPNRCTGIDTFIPFSRTGPEKRTGMLQKRSRRLQTRFADEGELILPGFSGLPRRHTAQRGRLRALVERHVHQPEDIPATPSFPAVARQPVQRSVDTEPSSRFCDARAPACMRPASPGCCVEPLTDFPALLRDTAAGLFGNQVRPTTRETTS